MRSTVLSLAPGGACSRRRAIAVPVPARPRRRRRSHRHRAPTSAGRRSSTRRRRSSTLRRDDLAATGANEIGRVLEDLTINTGSQNNPDAFTQNFTTGTSNVNLRGLGVSSTLVLINGRRQTQSAVATDRGENFVDTSSLPPMIAFERIEMLKDGATALYGSEAVAGVVNFITRSDFEGFDLELALQGNDNYPQQDAQMSGLYGGGNDDTHVLVAFSHLDREPLTTYDRRLSGPTDDLSQAGNPGLVPRAVAARAIPRIAPSGRRRSTATATASRTSSSRRSGCRPCRARSRRSSPIRTAPRSRRRIRRSCPRSRSAVPSPIGAIPIGLCAVRFRRLLLDRARGAAQQRVRRAHARVRRHAGRPHRGARRRQRSAAQQLAVVPVRGVPDGRGEPSRQSVRQRRALHRPHHRRRRRARSRASTTPTRGASRPR